MIVRSIAANVGDVAFDVIRAGAANLSNVQRHENVLTFQPALLVPGWVDRSKAPHIEKIDIEDIAGGADILRFKDAAFSLKFELAGKKQIFTERIELHTTFEEFHE